MPLQETSGAASYDAFGGGVADRVYVEDVFSTWLYTGNFSTQTITNNIDLSGEGGLLWIKNRTSAGSNILFDTARGADNLLQTNQANAQSNSVGYMSTFNSNGFGLVSNYPTNTSGNSYVSWTFRKQPKFFDVVTYTGDGTSDRQIAHSLNSVPGCVIVKKTNAAQNWAVWHRTFSTGDHMYLNTTNAVVNNTVAFGTSANTSTTFNVGSFLNAFGDTYVAYLFAHNAGGFGLEGTDDVISCGSYTGAVSNPFITLGYEPQWIMRKRTDSTGNWEIVDNMRGLYAPSRIEPSLQPNLSNAESSLTMYLYPTATGFEDANTTNGATYIYIAIRRGPMKVPTSGTEVYNAIARTGTGAVANVTGLGFTPDLAISKGRDASLLPWDWQDRLRGATRYIKSNDTAAEAVDANSLTAFNMNGVTLGADPSVGQWNYLDEPYIQSFFKRAPGFFDVVCYTGTGSARTVAHNLAAVPELMIVKQRSGTTTWPVYDKFNGATKFLQVSADVLSQASSLPWGDTTPTASVFSVGGGSPAWVNASGSTYVAYLFATAAGVSKVGSYTGTGTTLQIDCGFTGGARFVLIKRTDSTGDWYVWDSARGIVSGNDPYLLLNSTAAEVTSTDYIDTYSAGFEISSTAPAAINANGGSFIFLAIA